MNKIETAGQQFRAYQQNHEEKGSDDKAKVNAIHAATLEKLVSDLKGIHGVSMSEGNAHASHYMRGMANGAELMMATIEDRGPNFISEDKVVPGLSDHVRMIGDWAHDRNLVAGGTVQAQTVKLGEEFGELCAGVARHDLDLIADSIGDVTVVMIIIALQMGLEFDTCVAKAYEEIKDRRGRMVDGIFVKDAE